MDQAPIAVPDRPAVTVESRQASRPLDAAWVGGVCAGLAHHLGWSVLVLRVGFVLLGAAQFFGVILYLVLWLLLPQASARKAAGIEAATRTGMRTAARTRVGGDIGALLALGSLGVGIMALLAVLGLGIGWEHTLGGSVASIGIGLVWWQADRFDARTVTDPAGKPRWTVRVRQGGWIGWAAVVAGVALLAGAGWWFVAVSSLSVTARTGLIVAIVVAGLVLVAAPFLTRLRFALAAAREAKLVADTQADIAAHLHDSVLQTLALIQRQADSPQTVSHLARKQERELRAWLYGEVADSTDTLASALKGAAAQVEDDFGAAVEVVVVGDAALTEHLEALVAAAREAMVNAAKHSGRLEIDVFAEVADGLAEVFVRDRGVGFDASAMPADRQGVRGSIMDRMARYGGKAVVRSTPGEGTEIRLEMRSDD